jgi:hypothetical protein
MLISYVLTDSMSVTKHSLATRHWAWNRFWILWNIDRLRFLTRFIAVLIDTVLTLTSRTDDWEAITITQDFATPLAHLAF